MSQVVQHGLRESHHGRGEQVPAIASGDEKRSKRLADVGQRLDWPSNLWIGVSIESSKYRFRLDHLRKVDAALRFVSAEPLLGPLDDLDLDGIHWLIAGGESGPGARPIEEVWILDLRDQCGVAGVPFFFKQWGGRTPKAGGRELLGKTHDAMPDRTVALS